MKQYIVTITYDPAYGIYEARCPDAPGMFVDCKTLEEAIEVVQDVLPEMIAETISYNSTHNNAILYNIANFNEHRAH